MKLAITNSNGQTIGEHIVGFRPIETMRGTQAVHDTVTAYLANQRTGTASTKTAGEVAGSNRKPWRQKGTGRARAGSFQSPLWVGGGVVFGPRPRDFSKKVNKKTRQMSLVKALSERIIAGDVVIIEGKIVDKPKTKLMVGLFERIRLPGTVLIVQDTVDMNVTLACRNLPFVDIVSSDEVNTYQILKSDKVIFTLSAFGKVEERLRV